MSLPIDNTVMELATKDVHCKMKKLVGDFHLNDICLTLCDQVDDICGIHC